MMLRYAKNYLKIVNHKGWVRAPVCLHSTDTKRDFSVGAQGNQNETTKPGNLSDQSLSKPLKDPAKLWTKGILDGAILTEKDFGRQNGQGLLMMKTSLDRYQQYGFLPFSNSALTVQRFINSILSGPSTTSPSTLSMHLIKPYEPFSRDVSNKYECNAEPKTIEPTMQPMCPPYTPPPALPCPKPCVPPQFPMQPKCPPKVKKAIDCPKYPYPLPPCPRPKIPSPPPPCKSKEQSSQLNKLTSSEIDNVIDFNEPMHIMTNTLSNSTCGTSPSVSNDPCESEIYSHDGRTNKPVGSPRLCESASLNKSACGDAQFKFSSANTAGRSEFSEPTRKYQDPTPVKKPQNRDEIDMFDIHEHIHEAQYIETENDINNVSKYGPQAPIFCDGRKKKKCNGGRQGNCKPSPGKSPCCAPPVCTPPCPPPCSPCPIPPPPCLPTGPRIKYKPPPPQVPCSPCPVRCPPCPRPPPPMCPPTCPPPCRPRCPIYGPNPPTPDCPGPLFVPSCPCPNPCPPPCEENTEPPCCPQCPLPCPPKCPPPCPPTCPTKYPPQPKGPCDPHNLLTTGMVLTGESDKSATPDRPSEELLPQSLSETESSPFQPKKVYKTSACSCAARSQPLVVIPAQTTTCNYPILLPKKKICSDTCPEFCYDSKVKPKMCPAPRSDTEYCKKLEGGETEYFEKIVTLGSQIKSTPLKENPKVNFASSPPPQSTQPPSSEPPNAGGGDDPNKYRKFIWPLLVAIGALGGVYYFGFHNDTVNVDDSKSKKQKEPKRPIKKIPLHATEIPSHAKYLLIGGGTASFVAFRAIKATDPKAKVLIISGEDAYPYMRPPLSKEIWQYDKLPVDYNQLTFKQWNGRERSLYYEPPEFYLPPEKLDMSENGGVAIATGWYVSRVDAENKKAFIIVPGKEDKEISYEKCLIATGCTPRILPQFMDASKDVEKRTVHFRNIRDLDRLWRKLEDPTTKSVVIIGGGFLGSELACSLGRNKIDNPGRKVLQIFKEPGSMGKALPEYLSKWTSKRVEAEGVEVMADTTVEDVNWSNGKVQLRLNENRQVSADLVIVAVGCEPCTALAEVSKLEVDPVHGGFLVNAELEARRDLYVAGDAACFYDPSLGRRRVEHHDHAVVSGRLAGENMASNNPRPYQHQSMFWSDLSPDLGYEAIGLVDASLATVGVFVKPTPADDTPKENEPKIADGKEQEAQSIDLQNGSHTTEAEKNYGKGVIFYLKQDKLVGIVLWNVFNRMSIARQVLAQGKTYDDLNEVAKLFKIHDDEEE